ncbi:MAG: T9SS type A sorting domain-containing protein [Rhodothermales bacterium]|nr:T9SS type A sorting domain-containing protein [Rhodothermales bacterium]MBO6778411.1 T9SS type A sorting domain-containing protein [Rhodothermales bacterium]
MSRRFLALLIVFAPAFAASAQTGGAEDYCFLVADNNGVRFDADVVTQVEKATGLETEIGMTGTLNIEAVAFHPFEPGIFAADGGLLGTINVETGRFAPVGWLGTAYGDEGPLSAGDVDGMTFDPTTGELFGAVRKSAFDFLVQIDPASGRVVEDAFGSGKDYVRVSFGSTDVHVDDIAISPTTGDFVAVVTDAAENSTLVSIDRQTGVATTIAPLATQDLEGLTFDPAGRLFATPGGDGPNMVEIDLATGNATPWAAIGVNSNRDYEAVTCMAHGAMSSSSESSELPGEVALLPAYPNPFNPTTTFGYTLPVGSDVRLSVFDMLGREVEVLESGFRAAGAHEARFDASGLPSGLYMYRITGPGFVLTRSVTLLR